MKGTLRTDVRSKIRRSLDVAGSALEPLAKRAHGPRFAVLTYHEVCDQDRFAAHVEHLCRNYHPIGLADIERAGDRPLPADAVLVTFDDGHRSVFDVALPVLERAGVPGVAFVTAGLIDSDAAPWWVEVATLAAELGCHGDGEVRRLKLVPDEQRLARLAELRDQVGDRVRVRNLATHEVRSLEASGIRVENHSWSHPLLDRCSTAKIRREIGRAGQRLEAILERPVRAIAYPNGNVDERVLRVTAELGYRHGFLFDHRLTSAIGERPLLLSRLRVDAAASIERLRSILGGVHPLVHSLRGLA